MELPKNIRQIGENDTSNHIYIEDYVITYLYQLKETAELEPQIIIFLGTLKKENDESYFYVSGAIGLTKKYLNDDSELINEEEKNKVLLEKDRFFADLDILGWGVMENSFRKISNSYIWDNETDFFTLEERLLCRIENEGKDLKWYLYKNGIQQRLDGYAIFYDQNVKMQNYLITWHKENSRRNMENVSDRATRQFRSIIQEKREKAYTKHMVPFFAGMCFTAMIVVSVIGITTINQYDKMVRVENSVLELTQAMRESEEAMKAIHMESGNHFDNDMDVNSDQYSDIGKEEKQKPVEKTNEEKTETESRLETEPEIQEEAEIQSGIEQQNEVGMQSEPEIQTEYQIYYVEEGDTLAHISYTYYHSLDKIDEICSLNHITDSNKIIVGEKILLP